MDHDHFNIVANIKCEIIDEVLHFLISHVEMLCKLFVNVKAWGARQAPIAKVCSIIYN